MEDATKIAVEEIERDIHHFLSRGTVTAVIGWSSFDSVVKSLSGNQT